MSAPAVPVNRPLVGAVALGCIGLSLFLWWLEPEDGTSLLQSAFLRVGLLLIVAFLALPTSANDQAWARITIWKLFAILGGMLIVVQTKIPLRFILPALAVAALTILILRPRPKTRPGQSRF